MKSLEEIKKEIEEFVKEREDRDKYNISGKRRRPLEGYHDNSYFVSQGRKIERDKIKGYDESKG